MTEQIDQWRHYVRLVEDAHREGVTPPLPPDERLADDVRLRRRKQQATDRQLERPGGARRARSAEMAPVSFQGAHPEDPPRPTPPSRPSPTTFGPGSCCADARRATHGFGICWGPRWVGRLRRQGT